MFHVLCAILNIDKHCENVISTLIPNKISNIDFIYFAWEIPLAIHITLNLEQKYKYETYVELKIEYN